MHIERDQADAVKLLSVGAVGLGGGDTVQVGAAETAVLSESGKPERVLGPGSYTVPEEFAGPYKVLDFVTTRPFRDMRFGGRLGPVPLASGPVSQAFGTFTIRVVSAERVVVNFGGAADGVDIDEVGAWLKGEILRALAEILATNRGQELSDLLGGLPAELEARLAGVAEKGVSVDSFEGLQIS